MTLVPMKGLVGGVAKLEDTDPRAARMLVQIGLFEALQDQINEVREPMTQQVMKNIAEINTTARRRVERSQIAKSDEAVPYMAGLDVIDDVVEKGIVGDLVGHALTMFNRQHPRDDKGRFIRHNLASGTDPNLPATARLASHQTEATAWRDKMVESGLIDGKTTMHLGVSLVDDKGRVSSTRRHLKTRADELERALVQVPGHMPVQLSVARRDLKRMSPQQLAAVDLTSLSMQEQFTDAHAMTRGLFDNKGNVKVDGQSAADSWYGQTKGTDRQAYRRIKQTGQVLSHFGAPGGTSSAVGGLAQLVGEIGPEAEKILGPGIRRTAYRYRGTERRPDRDLYTSVHSATRYGDLLADDRTFAQAKDLVNAEAKDPENVAARITQEYLSGSITEDQRDLQIRGGAAVASLLGVGKGGRHHSRLPDLKLVELSLESGEMPPSEGVIIDARGRVVTQAIGYNGDHYLPFDLRNLGALQGGQYVRTRATGGPTTEDIYTSLVTGARQIQVVSNSGVFTVEFDPDLRGVRRFNDKVARMVERYGSLLETIHNNRGTLFENDLDAGTKAELRQQAAAAANGDQKKYEDNYNKLVARARFENSGSRRDFEELETQAYARAKTIVNAQISDSRERFSEQAKARLIEETARDWINQQDPGVRELELNGEGYRQALKALQQEFPYYIRQTSFQTLPTWLSEHNLPTMGYRRNAPSEKGYVEPGQTNTPKARRGGFRTARYVPTGAKREEETEQSTPQTQQRGQTTQTQTQTGTGAQAPATGQQQPTAAAQVDVPKLVTEQLGKDVHPLVGIIHDAPPASDYPASSLSIPDVLAGGYSAQNFARFVATKLINQAPEGKEGQAVADWLAKAPPRERSEFFKGVNQLIDDEDALRTIRVDPQRVKDHLKRVQDTFGLLEPFATPEEGQPLWAVNPTGGKPADYGDTPTWDADISEWEQAESQFAVDHGPDFVSHYERMRSMTPALRQQEAVDDYNQYEKAKKTGGELDTLQQQLDWTQRAWSFLHARDVARKLRELAGTDAGPKAQEAEGFFTKRLLYDPPATDFLLDLRNQIDGLLSRD